MHCISAIIDNLYKHQTKIPLCSEELLQTSYLTVLRHHECLKSKCAQQATFEQLAFGQAVKQPKSNCFFSLDFETTVTSEFCMQTGIAGMLFQTRHGVVVEKSTKNLILQMYLKIRLQLYPSEKASSKNIFTQLINYI